MAVSHTLEISRLRSYKDFAMVHKDWYYQEYFIKRYINDLPLMAFELFGMKLTYQQMDIWEEYQQGGGFMGGRLTVPSGHGCHGKNTPILMYDKSIKLVQDIKEDELIMGDNGTPRTVLRLQRGQEKMYRFYLSNGLTREYNLSHKLCIIYKNDKYTVTVDKYLKLKDKSRVRLYDKDDNLIAIKHTHSLGKKDYYGFVLDGNSRYLDGNEIVTHNSGKTAFIGVIASAFMLLFPNSKVRILAPKTEQVTKYSFKEINSCFGTLKNKRKLANGKIFQSRWSFLYDYFQFNKTSIYVKNYSESWLIYPASNPRSPAESSNLAGEHNRYYLLLVDEASSVQDIAIETSLGALTESFNSCIMFSQHTRLVGKFHDFTVNKNIEKGGHWRVLRLDASQSPMVDSKQLIKWETTYTSDEYRVRVKGLPPIHEDGMLISTNQAYSIYENFNFKKLEPLLNTLIFSYDLGYSGIRDSSVLTTLEATAIKSEVTDRVKPYFDIKDIDVYQGTNGKLPIEFIQTVFKQILRTLDEYSEYKTYDRIIVVGDSSVAGEEPFRKLEEMFLEISTYDIEFIGLKWGTDRLYFGDKQRFINMRAKCWVNLKEALDEKRIRNSTDKHQHKVLHELTNIPYTFDSKFRYKMASKEDMKKKSINSPDVGDTLAQVFAIRFDDGFSVDDDSLNEYDNLVPLDDDDFEDEILESEIVEAEEIEDDEVSNIDILMPTTISNYTNEEHKERLEKSKKQLDLLDLLDDDF